MIDKIPVPKPVESPDDKPHSRPALAAALVAALAGVPEVSAQVPVEPARKMSPARPARPGMDGRPTSSHKVWIDPDSITRPKTPAPSQGDVSPTPKKSPGLIQKENPVEEVIAFSRRVHEAGIESPEDFFSFFLGKAQGGARPRIPEYTERGQNIFYPTGMLDVKKRPVLRIMLQRNGDPFAATVVRVGKDEVLASGFSAALLDDPKSLKLQTLPPEGTNLILRRLNVPLQGEHAQTPIVNPLPEVSETEIRRGTYAVSVGQGERNAGEDIANYDTTIGTFFLSGFLLSGKNDPVVKELVLKQLTSSGMPAEFNGWFSELLNNAHVLVGSSSEAREMLYRKIAPCQPVFAAVKGSKDLKRMGYVTLGPILLTQDGSMVKFDENGRADKPFVPVYIVEGRGSVLKAIGK